MHAFRVAVNLVGVHNDCYGGASPLCHRGAWWRSRTGGRRRLSYGTMDVKVMRLKPSLHKQHRGRVSNRRAWVKAIRLKLGARTPLLG